jgi:methionyl-tRNA synthetase
MKNINPYVFERKRQDVCDGCGKLIENHEKECPTCGKFPHKAYHERAAAQTLGISKWLQTGPAMQPNQKISESSGIKLTNLIEYSNFY